MYKPKSLRLINIGSHQDTLYNFRNGEAIIVIGENKDNASQLRNGSGKSFLASEGIAIATTGESIRNVKIKELIRKGCDSAEIEIVYESDKEELKIWRKLHAGAKSSEVKVYKDGLAQVRSDVNEYNKLIFAELGISKEDFFDFYLITKEHYSPFFAIGDGKKKEIINRFSGAEKVDEVIPHIDKDLDEKSTAVSTLNKNLSSNEGKRELLATQIEAEKKKFSDQEKADRIAQADNELIVLLDTAETIQEETALKEKEIPEKQLIIEQCEVKIADYDKQLKVLQTNYDTLNKIVEAKKLLLPKVKEKFQLRIESIQRLDEINKETINKAEGDIKAHGITKAALENKLAGVLECPKCSYEFTIADKDFDAIKARVDLQHIETLLENAKLALTELQKDEVSLKQQKEKLNQEIVTAGSDLKNEIVALNDQLTVINNSKKKLSDDRMYSHLKQKTNQNLLEDLRERIVKLNKSLETNIDDCEKKQVEIELIRNQESELLSSLEQQLADLLEEETLLKDRLQEAVDEETAVNQWYTNFKNFKSYLANQSIKNIADYTNMYLHEMGSDLSISMEGYRMLASKKLKEEISISVLRNGFDEGSYGKFSAGERSRIDVSCILAIQSLINLNSPTGGIDLLVCDEIMDSVDTSGLENIIESLQNTDRTIMIVSQQEINSLAEQTLIVRKENGISKIV